MPDVIITPSSGIIDFFPASTRVGRIEGSGNTFNITNPSGYVVVSGSGLSINSSSTNATLNVYSATSGDTLLNVAGTNGSLFSVVDSLSGTLFGVNTVAGLPVFEVFSDYSVKGGRYNQNDFIISSGGNVGIGTGTPSAKLHVSNDIKATEIDFAKIGESTTQASIYLSNSDLVISSVSGDIIVGDVTQDIYIGNGTNEIDIIFEQNGEIRPLANKTLTIGASGAYTTLLANKIGINRASLGTIPLDVYSSTSGATILNVEGTNGNLFSIVDSLSGSLMSVNNNAGLPVFEVFSDDRLVAGRFGQNDFIMTSGGNVGIGTGVPSSKFHVVGTSTFNGDVSSTGSFIGGSGTAALPSFEFINDPDTGLFSPAANTLSISTSGIERLRINNAGNVGINTTSYEFNNIVASDTAKLSVNGPLWCHNNLQIGPSDNAFDYSWITNGTAIFNILGVGEKVYTPGNSVIMDSNGLIVNNGGGTGGTACELLGDYGATIKPNLIVDSNGNGPARLGVGTGNPIVELHVNGNSLISSGNFTTALTIGNSGVATWDVPILSLGTISGTNSINWGADRTMQSCTLNGTATTLNKGTGWPSTNGVSREVTLNIYASGNTSVTWNIVNDWYRQPDSPLPSGNHIVLLRAISSGVIQGHYIGNKTN